MDPHGPDSSSEGLFESNLPPSPSPASRHMYPASPKDIAASSNLAFRPPPRPGSSLRKGRKSDFNTPAPPPLPSAPMPTYEHRPLADATNFSSHHSNLHDTPMLSTPSRASMRPSSSRQSSAKTVDLTRTVRERLQVLREENETQVNSAGMLGQGLLELRGKIETMMDELAEELSAAEEQSEDSHDGKPGNARIRDLSEKIEAEIEELERQKQKLFSDITVHSADITNGDAADNSTLSLAETPSKATRVADAIRNLTATPGKSPAAPTGNTPRQTDRRSRNAAARQAKADTDLINEIQAGLVQEVRRLQGLLKERDDQRIALERSQADLEKQLDQYKPRVIQMTETEDALKQENWDLNVSKQNLEEQLSEIKAALKKAETDNLRLNKEVGKARETVDSQRLQIDGHVAEIERINKSRETEVALARRERAGMQRDVSDLQSELQKFRNQQLNNGGVSRSVSNSFVSDLNHDANDDADALAARLRAASGEAPRSPNDSIYSTDGAVLSPLGNRLGRDKETQDLRAKLALAQRKAGKDAAEKRRVREKNVELSKLLVKAGVKVPQGLDDDAETSEDEELHWMDEDEAHSPSAKRLSRIGANRAGASMRPRLGRKMGMVSSNSTDSIIEYEEYEDDSQMGTPAGPEDASPSRASLEGMDPAFADFGRADAGNASIDSVASRNAHRGHRSRPSIGSPLARNAHLPQEDDEQESPSQERVLPKSGRRSGATVRATSAVFEPSALGNELGGLAAELEQYQPAVEEREMFENSMQTDELPDLVAPALARRDEEHKAEIAKIRNEHDNAIEAIYAEHATKTTTLQGDHRKALNQLKEKHEKEITELTAAHEQSLNEKDESHSALMESTLAERNKTHEESLAEARSRHSNALAEQVAASSAALAAAVAAHKTSSEDFERKVKEEKERKEESHAFALAQKDRQHKGAVDVLEASHADALTRLRDEHQQLLAIREKALEDADAQLAERQKANEELSASHASALAALRDEHQQLLAIREKALEDADAQLAEHKKAKEEISASHASALTALHESHREVLAGRDAQLEISKQELAERLKANEELTASHASALAALQASHREALAGRDVQLAERQKANEELSASHASALAALQESHREALADRDAQLESSKQELEARTEELRVARSEIAELQKSIATLRAETEQLKQQLAELQKTHTATERELSETNSNLDMVNDKVRRQEETSLELARQREAEATAAAAAVAARSEALTATEAQKEQLEAAHAVAIAQKERQHQDAVKELEDRHTKTVTQIRADHKQALESRDASIADKERQHQDAVKELEDRHAKAVTQIRAEHKQALESRDASIADKERQHQDAVKELEDRHAKAVTEIREEHKQALESRDASIAQKEREHQDAVNELEDRHTKTVDEIRADHKQALESRDASVAEKARKHQDAVKELEDRHTTTVTQIRDEHKQALKSRDASLQTHQQLVSEHERTREEQRTELQKTQSQVRSLEQQLAKLQSDVTLAQESRSTIEANLKEAETAHSTLQKQHDESKATVASLQSKVRYLESSIAAQRSSTEQNRLASDKELQTIQSALNTAQKKVREQEATIAKAEAAVAAALAAAAIAEAQLQAKNDAVTDTENEADDFEDAEAGDAASEEGDVTRKPPAVELKESSCQTDDEAWKQFLQQQQRKVAPATRSSTTQTSAPPSPMKPTSESVAAHNNLMVLGGVKSANRARDSVGTFGGEHSSSPATMLYSADAFTSRNSRRQSVDSTWSRHTDRNEIIPPVPPLPDKTKAPIMSMPPPPSMPPPSSLQRSVMAGAGQAPGRPTSPPPADLLTRAQARHLQVPAGTGEQPRSVSRASTRVGPPPSAYPAASNNRARQQSSGTGSVRSRTYSGENSALDGSIYSTMTPGRKSIGSRKSAGRSRPSAGPRQSSAASFVSDVTSEVSRRLSMMSSRASEADVGDETFVVRGHGAAGRSHGPRGMSEFGAESTDPAVIHAITQTMIGEYMFKYTRKSMGRGGHSDKRHRRYFWLHPYTKMLYWTISDPGGAKVSEGTSKSASIEHVRVVEDSNPSPPGLHGESIIITTASREVKISAPSRERHEAWLTALEYLVHRPTMQDATVIASGAAPELMSDAENDPNLVTRSVGRRAKPRASAATMGSASITGKRSFLMRRSSDHALTTESSTPRRRQGSMGGQSVLYPSLSKRKDVPAKAWLQQHEHDRELSVSMSPSHSMRNGIYPASVRSANVADDDYDMMDSTATQSPIRRALANDDPRLKTAEQMLEEDEPEDWDGLTNVRACCDGKHDVGSLAHDHHHHSQRPGSATGSRKSSRLHRRGSSGGSRFSSIGLKSKLDAAVKSAEEREQQQQAAPRIPSSVLPTLPSGAALGPVVPERMSMDSNASESMPTNEAGNRLKVVEANFAGVFAATEQGSRAGTPSGGPSYGERVKQIRKARQSGGSTSGK